MKVEAFVVKNIIRKLLAGEDYRAEVVALIDAEFLQYVVDFFKRVATAKLDNQHISGDWFKTELLNKDLPKEDLVIHSGLNMKTVNNMYNSVTKQVVLDASIEHYDALYKAVQNLTAQETDVDITLTIKFNKVSVDLNISESLIVINTIAVKRAALRGGVWSTAGKQVEKPLMRTLCALLQVPKRYYDQSAIPTHGREVDFYLIDAAGRHQRCEVKLMGKGNPESMDAVVARDSAIFIADKLSDLNIRELDQRGILWVQLRNASDYTTFEAVLDKLGIPHKPIPGKLNQKIEKVLDVVLADESALPQSPFQVSEEAADYSEEYLVSFAEENEQT